MSDPMTDKMRIWEQVCKTDPVNTSQAGRLTAISAMSQIQKMTEIFGPCGEGWGYELEEFAGPPELLIFKVRLWWAGDDGSRSITQFGSCSWKDFKDRWDSDAPKKALTDGMTKCMSLLGFNADVFMGRFDEKPERAPERPAFRRPSKPIGEENTPSEPERASKRLPPKEIREMLGPQGPREPEYVSEEPPEAPQVAINDPYWFSEHAPFKKFGSPEWGEMASGGIDGDHYSYMKWATGDGGFLSEKRGKAWERARYCMAVIEKRDDERQAEIDAQPEEESGEIPF